MSQLIRYDAACRALAEARQVDEAKDLRDKAEAMRAYAHQAKNKQLEVDAAEIRFRAERRLGELIRAQKETVGLAKGGQPYQASTGSDKEPVDRAPTLAQAGIDKKLSSRAQKIAAIPEQEFESQIGEWRSRVERETERVTTNLLREGERAQRTERQHVAPPEGKFSLIYADPPWRYEHVRTESRAIENQYPTMDLDEICALPIPDVAHDDCVLFLWATSPKLWESMRVIDAWGFTYRTCAVWDKQKIGMGYYFRQRHELLLVAAKGALPVPEASERVSSVIVAPRAEHSRKPDVVYELIEAMYPDTTKIELFCRRPREGWSAWGNEVA